MDKNTIDILTYKCRIPYDVIRRHIIPYTYLPQSDELLWDIRHYKPDINILESIYYTQYNEFILLTDLLMFHGYTYNMKYISAEMLELFKRHIILTKMDNTYLNNFIKKFCRTIRRKRAIKFIWGLMTIDERNKFMNEFIITDTID